MIIVQITGGLGNQMFQYAMGRRLALHHKTELLLDTSSYEGGFEARPKNLAAFARPLALFHFAVKARIATATEIQQLKDDYYRSTTRDRIVRQIRRFHKSFLWKHSHVIEHQYRFQPEALEYPDNTYLQGFWQSPKYFTDVASTIQQDFTPVDESIQTSAEKYVGNLRSRYESVVSLHVRRGDLAHAHEVLGNKGITHGAPIGLEYIHQAILRFPENTCFLVFSDSPKDIEWCRRNIQAPNLEFSDASSDLWDFIVMKSCDHHVIANSTFSWWAAWLDPNPDHRVISPRMWSPPESRFIMHTDDLLPPYWQTL